MLITLTGKPGTGKTLTMTNICRKNFNEKNPRLKVWFTEKIRRKPYVYDLSEYSDFPILLKKPKKNKIYYYYDENGEVKKSNYLMSLKFRIFDLILDNKFKEGANFYIDEIQAKYDSMEYKDFPDSIAHYCQAHRHFDNNIYCSSQSQSRIIKRVLVLSEEYWTIQNFRNLFGLAIVSIRRTWEMSANLENNVINENLIDVDYFKQIYRIKKVGSMYDSKYLRYLQEGAKPYRSCMYQSLQLDKNTLLKTFFPSDEERKHLRDMRY